MAEIILGIDHGNGNMKGSNVDFPCGLVRYTSEPGRFMNEDILEYQGTFYTLSETRMPFKADKTVDEDYFILTLFALALEAKSRGITLTGKDIVLGVGLPPADFSQQAPGFKKYFMEHAKHGISFKFNGKSVSCYLKDTFVRDRSIPYYRVMLQIKNNLAPEGKAYVFELNPDYGFRWIGQEEYEVEDLLVHKTKTESKLDKAKDYLRLLLNGTDMACADILDKMRANGIGKRTVEQAKKDMGIISYKLGDKWYWQLNGSDASGERI